MERDDIEAAIRMAFAGVRLGAGVSLRQAEVIDDYGRGYTRAEFDALPRSEVTDDWTLVPETELLRDNSWHLDREGLRYYLPALMLWLLDHYHEDGWLTGEGTLMTTIGTVRALAPEPRFEKPMWWKYEIFSPAQKAAIASYLDALPGLVELDREDATAVAGSMERYWGQFLPHP